MSWVLSIDFGTSNTTAAHTVDGVPQVLEVDGGRYLPSAVVADPEAGLVTGREARRQVSLYPERAERTPKRSLASGDLVVLGQKAYPAAEVAGAVLARMYGEAVRFHGSAPPDLVILTHPARWGEKVTQRLREAAMLAGITAAAPLQLLPEPEAAAWFYAPPRDGQVVAVFDLGGGTLDTAVLKAAGGGFALRGQPGGDAELGGEDFDELLLEWVAARARERDEELWEELESGTSRRARQDWARLRIAVTDAKEALSTHLKAGVTVGDFEDEFHVTRDDFEKLITGTVRRAVTELRRTIAASGVSMASLAGLYLTGGSSRTPLIGKRLWEEFGVQPQLLNDPKTVVAEGALRAHAEAAAAKATARKAAEREAAARDAQEAARKAREEAARKAREEAARKAREEAARRTREEAERKARLPEEEALERLCQHAQEPAWLQGRLKDYLMPIAAVLAREERVIGVRLISAAAVGFGSGDYCAVAVTSDHLYFGQHGRHFGWQKIFEKTPAPFRATANVIIIPWAEFNGCDLTRLTTNRAGTEGKVIFKLKIKGQKAVRFNTWYTEARDVMRLIDARG